MRRVAGEMPRTVGQISRHFGVRLVSGTMAEVPRNNARSLASQPRRHSERDRGEEDGNGAWWRSGKWALAAGAAAVAGEVVRQRAQCESGAVLKVKNVLPLGSIAERFRIEATLGEGGQAVVYKAYDKKDKKMVAIKVTSKSHAQAVELVNIEVDVFRSVGKHTNVVSLHDVLETNNEYIMVIDLADGGALFDLIIEAGNLTEAQASDHVLQVVQGLLHMHRMRVSHCDIKPENMLISSEGNCKSVMLCDLGMARRYKSGDGFLLGYDSGTFDYWAPEIVRKQECTEAVDMWALGVVTYIMLCGSNPFDPYGTATDSELLHNVVISKIDTENEMWQHLSSPCKDLIRGLLTIEPTARLTAEQVLQHPWMVNQNTTAEMPPVHLQRLKGYHALASLRGSVKALSIAPDFLFDKCKHNHQELDVKDLQGVFEMLGLKLSDDALNAIMLLGDASGDGVLDRTEFKLMIRANDRDKGANLTETQIKQLFSIFDQNGDGEISPEELQAVLGLLGKNVSLDRATGFIVQEVGPKGAERLSYADFQRVMLSGALSHVSDAK